MKKIIVNEKFNPQSDPPPTAAEYKSVKEIIVKDKPKAEIVRIYRSELEKIECESCGSLMCYSNAFDLNGSRFYCLDCAVNDEDVENDCFCCEYE